MNKNEIINICIIQTDEETIKSKIKYSIDCDGVEGFLE